ncbi:MAG: 2OG-Fe(II) oxygenase [Gammaproteobacteria bacterium]|nr:2OG-Fe(II) oxygenase [Gammaproteobacteria bacterium]
MIVIIAALICALALRGINVVATWLNEQQVSEDAILAYRQTLLRSSPHHVVIDDLFDADRLQAVCAQLKKNEQWQTQKHSYSALYVKDATWQKTPSSERFVQRDVWQRPPAAQPAALSTEAPLSSETASTETVSSETATANVAAEFLQYLRSAEFMAVLSRIFAVELTDRNVAKPDINCNYFRLGPDDFVNQHADDSPGREVCMLLYLNENWSHQQGGELVFSGKYQKPVRIAPLYNRCVLFDPSAKGAEHWVNPVHRLANDDQASLQYRYNVTSWYWSE